MMVKSFEIKESGCTARLDVNLLENTAANVMDRIRPMVVICPGGGYTFCSDREAEPIALRFGAMGFHTCILRYSVAPEARFPVAVRQLARAVKLVRESAAEWKVDPDKIVVLGFSAGGHLATSLAVFWNRDFLYEGIGAKPEEIRPNGLISCYAVISTEYPHEGSYMSLLGERYGDPEAMELQSLEKQVTKDMPPAFIWHTVTDQGVPVENSMVLAAAMKKAGVPFALHLYQTGPHGLSLATMETGVEQPEAKDWSDKAGQWIRLYI